MRRFLDSACVAVYHAGSDVQRENRRSAPIFFLMLMGREKGLHPFFPEAARAQKGTTPFDA